MPRTGRIQEVQRVKRGVDWRYASGGPDGYGSSRPSQKAIEAAEHFLRHRDPWDEIRTANRSANDAH